MKKSLKIGKTRKFLKFEKKSDLKNWKIQLKSRCQKCCKVCQNKWPLKSAVRYPKTQNRLSPLWAHSDLGSQKRNTYATDFFLTLHSLWAPSDFVRPKSFSHSIFGAVNWVGGVGGVNQMGTWNWGLNLVVCARVMRTVRLLPQTTSKYIVYHMPYIVYETCVNISDNE